MADFPAEQPMDASALEISAGASVDPFGAELVQLSASGDDEAPVVSNFSPPLGSTIAAQDPIFFDVTDNSGQFKRVLVAIEQGSATELIHDGTSFLEPYDALSSRTNIQGGFRYRVRRSGGWVEDPTGQVFAFDKSGNEN